MCPCRMLRQHKGGLIIYRCVLALASGKSLGYLILGEQQSLAVVFYIRVYYSVYLTNQRLCFAELLAPKRKTAGHFLPHFTVNYGFSTTVFDSRPCQGPSVSTTTTLCKMPSRISVTRPAWVHRWSNEIHGTDRENSRPSPCVTRCRHFSLCT